MTKMKISMIALLAGTVIFSGFELGKQLSIPGAESLVPTAEAIVGRPLTPVSVAGVARRTARRCAVGVYNCSVPWLHSVESLVGQTDFPSYLPYPYETTSYYRLQHENLPVKG